MTGAVINHERNGTKNIEGPTNLNIFSIFILSRLKERPASGYDLASYINFITHGSWKPGSASIYPALKKLEKRGLIKRIQEGKRSKVVYDITEKGYVVLEKMKKEFDKYSEERWHRIRGMITHIVEPESLPKMLNETIEMQKEAWSRIINSEKITAEDKMFYLKEHKLLVEKHLNWINKTLEELGREKDA